MDIKTYLQTRALTCTDFASLVGASERAVIKWRRGERTPRDFFMQKIVEVTNGAVMPNDFFDLPTKEDAA